ncbi:TetR/AcrR family transcriptional regulator [Paenibacillus aestuarii]|uniref:TetR/AcrR family transcriptional regulator n=1 Tax=Paenibacillus aestuarii TaxID=516965 RepID=A0ABW0KBN2_9BACL|nr:TetR/AcrR family transcriptional regulator [Paenibacillus aestuarii]
MTSDTTQRSASFQLILDTTEQLVKEKGCRQTTLQDIIDRTGLSKGAIYHYVSGKDELFGLILKSKAEQMNERFQAAVAGTVGPDAVPPIQTITQGMIANTDKNDVGSKIFIYLLSQNENPKIAEMLTDLYNFSLRMATSWLEVGQKAGAIPPDIDANRAAAIFMTFTYGIRVQNVIAGDMHQALQADEVFRVIFRSLL